LGLPKAYGSYEALAADPDVHVVHIPTPNYLHAPGDSRGARAWQTLVSDKPLAMSSAEGRQLLELRRKAGESMR